MTIKITNIIILIVIGLLIFTTGCNIQTKKSNSPECKEYVENILPEKLVLRKLGDTYSISSWVWSDGQKVHITHPYLRFGEKEGENINYLYNHVNVRNAESRGQFEYKKEQINSEGVISKPIHIILGYIVLELSGNQRPTANPIWFNVDAKIIDYSVLKCEI